MTQPARADDPSIFMCKICNLFSPRKSQLLSHVLETHGGDNNQADDIIVPLKPLQAPQEASTELIVKRKRGRPKGSTKKLHVDEQTSERTSSEPQSDPSNLPSDPADQTKAEDGSGADLECKQCGRKFSNRRQISKHICFVKLKDAGDEEEDDPDAEKPEHEDDADKERPSKKVRTVRPDRCSTGSTARTRESANCPKPPVISVVLAAHEAIPGATKIVPIEAQQSNEVEPPTATEAEEPAQKKGYQEYAIQQGAFGTPLNSSRLGQTQLKIFTCEYCNKVFKFKHSLQSHLRIHTHEKPFKCPQCDYASAIKANLSVHMRKHTGEKFTCEHCSFTSLSKGHLKVHLERVHQKIKQHCRFCKKKYSDIKNLLKHIQESHDMQEEKVKNCYDEYKLRTREGKRQLLYDCNVCDRKFKYELERDRHLMVHGSNRPYGCELCDHGSTKFQALQAHVRRHPFVYICALCLQKFVSTVRLKAHLKGEHPEADGSAAFAESLTGSFCVLKPGDETQCDMLKQDELEITKELSLLNTQEVLVGEKVAQEAQGNGDLTIQTMVHQSEEDLQTDVENCLVIETGATLETGTLANDEKVHRTPSVSGGINDSEDLEVEDQPCISSNQQVDNTTRGESAGDWDQEPTVDQNKSAPGDGEVSIPRREEKSAFTQILDGLQKRQLSVEFFERIRKVYGDLECEYCGKLFWYQVHYSMHVRTHTREHLYYCSQCSYSSITKNSLKRHVIQRHSKVLLKCSTEGCVFSTPDKYKLQSHLKTHSGIVRKNVVCPVCKKSYPEDKLRHHVRTSHPDASLSAIMEALGIRVGSKGLIGKRGCKCPYCDFYFTRNGSDMQQHIWAHKGVKPFKCSHCDYATHNKSNLKAHMNRHSTERPHLCDLCGKKFKSKCTLKSHKLMHSTDGKQFKCTQCDFSAAQKHFLLRHMEQHASFKPFRCSHCCYSCNSVGSLKRHYNKKHPDEQFSSAGPQSAAPDNGQGQEGVKCPVCDYIYGTKWELSRHLKCKHGLKVLQNQWEVVESVEEPGAQYLQISETEDVQGTEAAVSVLQNLRFNAQNGVVSASAADGLDPASVNILQQIIELGTDSADATVASVVAMAPGTVTVVEQVTEEAQQTEHATMIHDALQQAAASLGEEHHLVVSSDDVEGIKTVTVYTQGDDASQFIVYVQEAVPTEGSTTEVV